MDNLLLADIVGLLHALFVLFVVGGQGAILLGWCFRWHWTQSWLWRWLHLGAISFVILESWFGIFCPLTTLEADLRGRGGETTFIGYWLERLLYFQAPSWVFTTVYTLFGGLVLVSFIFYPPRR